MGTTETGTVRILPALGMKKTIHRLIPTDRPHLPMSLAD